MMRLPQRGTQPGAVAQEVGADTFDHFQVRIFGGFFVGQQLAGIPVPVSGRNRRYPAV